LRGCVEGREARRRARAALKRRDAEAVPGGACPPPEKNRPNGPAAEKTALFLRRNNPLSHCQRMFLKVPRMCVENEKLNSAEVDAPGNSIGPTGLHDLGKSNRR
jgi:hypothetical protein